MLKAHTPGYRDILRGFRLIALATGALLLLAGASWADPSSEGDRLAPFSLEDQFGERHDVDASVSALLCASDMDGGDLIEAALEQNGAELLAGAGALYVANISRMPKIITKLFAMRSFRKRGYPMLLDREGELTKSLPGSEGQASLIALDQLEITSIRHFASAESLREALEARGSSTK